MPSSARARRGRCRAASVRESWIASAAASSAAAADADDVGAVAGDAAAGDDDDRADDGEAPADGAEDDAAGHGASTVQSVWAPGPRLTAARAHIHRDGSSHAPTPTVRPSRDFRSLTTERGTMTARPCPTSSAPNSRRGPRRASCISCRSSHRRGSTRPPRRDLKTTGSLPRSEPPRDSRGRTCEIPIVVGVGDCDLGGCKGERSRDACDKVVESDVVGGRERDASCEARAGASDGRLDDQRRSRRSRRPT